MTYQGRTALMYAALGGHEAVTELLVASGADVAAAGNDGVTALTVATQFGHVEVAKLLVERGAS